LLQSNPPPEFAQVIQPHSDSWYLALNCNIFLQSYRQSQCH
jgi:hypothetical protein